MPRVADFRTHAFDGPIVDASGKDVGRKVYWKLYAIENVLRVIVHSVLSAQVGPNWWAVSVDPSIQGQVRARMAEEANRPWYSTSGRHAIYYTFLSDLSRTIAANSHLFLPLLPDVDQWIARIEQIRVPRNIVGHMNWLSDTDRHRIDVFYADIHSLAIHLRTSGLNLLVP